MSTAARDPRPLASGAGPRVEIHCHCLPGVDDGPASMAEAIALCRALVADGIEIAIATPHQLGRYQGQNEPPAVRQAVAALNSALAAASVKLDVRPGGDVRVDERLVRLLDEDRILTLGDGGKWLLLELPHETLIDLHPVVQQLVARGIRPILSHPERHRGLVARPALLDRWLAAGLSLQITSGSFGGDFGETAKRAAWFWLETGAAGLVASDAHDVAHRPPRMSEAYRLIRRRLGDEVARRVCVENPQRVLDGAALEQASRQVDLDF